MVRACGGGGTYNVFNIHVRRFSSFASDNAVTHVLPCVVYLATQSFCVGRRGADSAVSKLGHRGWPASILRDRRGPDCLSLALFSFPPVSPPISLSNSLPSPSLSLFLFCLSLSLSLFPLPSPPVRALSLSLSFPSLSLSHSLFFFLLSLKVVPEEDVQWHGYTNFCHFFGDSGQVGEASPTASSGDAPIVA